MIASSPAVPEQKHVMSVPSNVNPLLAVHDGQPSSPFTVQHPLEPGEDPSLHTYAFAESIRDDAHAMSAKKKKEKKGVFVNAPPLDDRSMVLVNIIRLLSSFFCGLWSTKVRYMCAIFILFFGRERTRKGIS